MSKVCRLPGCGKEIPANRATAKCDYCCEDHAFREPTVRSVVPRRQAVRSFARRVVPASVRTALEEIKLLKSPEAKRGESVMVNSSTGEVTVGSTRQADPLPWTDFAEVDAAVDRLAFYYKMPMGEIRSGRSRYEFVRGFALGKACRPEVREDILDTLEAAMRRDNERAARVLNAVAYAERLYAQRGRK